MKCLLEYTDIELGQSKAFDELAAERSEKLKKSERDDYASAVRDVKTTGIASSRASRKVANKAHQDGVKTELAAEDGNIKNKVFERGKKHDLAIDAENKAKEAKKQKGYKKNFAHINQYIFDCQHGVVPGKEITRAEGQALRDLLGEYSYEFADKIMLIADYVKGDDQSGEAIDKKTKTRMSIDTDHTQIDPQKLRYLLENLKNMDLPMETTEQCAEAKEKIQQLLDNFNPKQQDPK